MSLKDIIRQSQKVSIADRRVKSVLSAMQVLSKQQGAASIETLHSTRPDLERAGQDLEENVSALLELIFQKADGVSHAA